MKLTFTLFLLLYSFLTYAKAISFTCSLDNDSKNNFSFQLENIGTDKVAFVVSNENDEYSSPFKTSAPKNSLIAKYEIVDTLNGQGGDVRNQSKGLFFFGDAVGCSFVDFMLYKDSGYKKGYLKAYFHCSDERPIYSLVSCKIK